MKTNLSRAAVRIRPALTLVSNAPGAPQISPAEARRRAELARAFESLADAAARGEIVGAAYAVIDEHSRTRQGLLGQAAENLPLAHYGVSRLADITLWPEMCD